MGTVNDILELAHSQLGNDGARYWNWYTDNVRPSQGYYRDGASTPYCAEYMSWLLAQTDTPCIYFPDPCAFDASDIKQSDRIPFDELKAGDIISFDWDKDKGGDHVGLVIANHGYYLETNEGNVGGYVCEMNRTSSDVLFGIRPDYGGSSKLVVDGDFGELTVMALQRQLQTRGFYTDYDIDGDFGYYTKSELQYYLSKLGYYRDFYCDGNFGIFSIAALQLRLAVLDLYTAKVDSDWGSYTTMCLQESLNDGSF